jgi:hypothetical protein
MSADEAGPAPTAIFTGRTIAALVVGGIVFFLLFLVLTAFAGTMRGGGGDPRSHALSKTAIGFYGLGRLIELSGAEIWLVRDEYEDGEELLVLTVEPQTDPARLASMLRNRGERPTLVILPKWQVQRDPANPTRVVSVGLLPAEWLQRILGEVAPIGVKDVRGDVPLTGRDMLKGVEAPPPESLRVVTGDVLTPMLALDGEDGSNGAVLARIGEAPHYLLADPDLMNNHGLRDPARASAALRIVAELNSTGARSVAFDLTLNGFRNERSPLRLAFEPPFLPLTVALFVAALLAGLHGAVRFGAPAEAGRAIAFGKSQLVENSAGLFKLARREHGSGGAYAELVREAAAFDSGAHLALGDAELDSYLDRVSPPDTPRFSELAGRARAARNAPDLLAAARALFQWKKDLLK